VSNLPAFSMSKSINAFFHIYGCLILALFIWSSVKIICFPFGVNYGEAPLMDQARRIELGEVIYKQNIDEPPYIITNYPPIYILTVAAFNSIFNIPIFQTGRLISLAFSPMSEQITVIETIYKIRPLNFSAILFWGIRILIWSSLARI
jgi:hypothetical protein